MRNIEQHHDAFPRWTGVLLLLVLCCFACAVAAGLARHPDILHKSGPSIPAVGAEDAGPAGGPAPTLDPADDSFDRGGTLSREAADSLILLCPDNLTLTCLEPTDPSFTGEPQVNSAGVTVSYGDQILPTFPSGCPEDFTISRVWTAVDSAGRSTFCIQVIFVADKIPPAMVCPGDTTVAWGTALDPRDLGEPEIEDDCHAVLTVIYDDVEVAGDYPRERTISRTWIAVDACGNTSECTQQIIELAAGVESKVLLTQNYPNPFRPGGGRVTAIDYILPREDRVVISIYDVVGRRLKTIVDRTLGSGVHFAVWDGRDADGAYVSSGVYLYHLRWSDESIFKKMAVIR